MNARQEWAKLESFYGLPGLWGFYLCEFSDAAVAELEASCSPACRLPTSDGLTDGEPTRIEPQTRQAGELDRYLADHRYSYGFALSWHGQQWRASPVEWQDARFTLPASRLTGLGPNFPREALGYERVVPVEWQAAGDVLAASDRYEWLLPYFAPTPATPMLWADKWWSLGPLQWQQGRPDVGGCVNPGG